MHKYDVTVIGVACCDIIFHGLPSFPKLGEEIWTDGVEVTAGGAMNTPAALSRLGLKIALATPIGNDFFGQFILSKIEEENISTEYIQRLDAPYPQVSVALNYDCDRAFVSYAEQSKTESYMEHLRHVIENTQSKLIHFYTSSDQEITELMKKTKKRGMIVSLDSGWDPVTLRSEQIKEQIRLADVFLPNLKEAQMITGKEDARDALEELSEITSTIVIKLGKDGAIGKWNGKVFESKGTEFDPIDSTGAGDCFVAGFLYGWLKEMDFKQCLSIANYCGGASVKAVGGYTGVPTEMQLQKDLLKSVQNI